jgi:hypothetical protein
VVTAKKVSRRRRIAKFFKFSFSFHRSTSPATVGIVAGSSSRSSQLPSSTEAGEEHNEGDKLNTEAVLHARNVRAELAKQLQSSTGMFQRTWQWTREDRKGFIEALSRIHKGNEKLEHICNIRATNHKESHPVEEIAENSQSGSAPYFRALESLLAIGPKSEGTSVHLRLHDDYYNYSRALRHTIPSMALAKNGYAFPLEASGFPNQESTPSRRKSTEVESVETNELLLNIAKNFDSTALSVENPWPAINFTPNTNPYLQHQTTRHTNGFDGQLFAHLPAKKHLKMTLREVISAGKPQDPMAVGLRSRTAASIVGFFHGCFEVNPSLSSLSLIYLLENPISELPARSVEPELQYLYLADVNNSQHPYFSDEESIVHQKNPGAMIRKLGLILYEIAAWKSLSTMAEDTPIMEALEKAQTQALDVQNTLGLGRLYYKSLMKCLNWDPQVKEPASVFRRDILEPLCKLSLFHPAPLNEKW